MKSKIHPGGTRIILSSILFLLLLSCRSSTDETNAFDHEKAMAEIEIRIRDYEEALGKGDLQALGKLYTIDAEILSHGRPSNMVRDSATVCGFETTGLWGNHELLVEQGTRFFAHSAGKWKSNGKYLLVWKKEEGEWRIFRDTWFRDPD